jgi:hypothetical protein
MSRACPVSVCVVSRVMATASAARTTMMKIALASANPD